MLILTEKPNVASDFAQTFGAQKFQDFYKTDNLTITYCVGHLFELAPPEYYNPDFKTWKIEDLPIVPGKFSYLKTTAAAKHTDEVLKLLREASARNEKIIIATDADREGELIARIVLEQADITDISNCFRFWESQALTPKVIKKGLENAKPLSNYNELSNQAHARQRADWLIGMNLSRFVSIGNPTVFSVGRVQTAVLCEIARRNYEVKTFVPVPYNELEAVIKDKNGNQIKAYLLNPENRKTSFPLGNEFLEKAKTICDGKMIEESNSKTAQKTQKPEKLLNINALQKSAYKLYGYSPEKTLEIAQRLYEVRKALSYPRTPSRVMGDENVELFREKFNLLKNDFKEISGFCNENLIRKENRHIFNSSELEAHHALIPLRKLPSDATKEEQNVFGIVVENFFKVCMDDFIFNEKTIIFECGGFSFKATIKDIVQEGWKKAERRNITAMGKTDEIQEVKNFDEKNCVITRFSKLEKKTQSPKEYSIDSLLSFMEKPKGEKQKKLLGLGTPATRAEIIAKLFEKQYVSEENRKLYATKKGFFLLSQLAKDRKLSKIANVNQTTIWENELSENPALFERHITEYVEDCIKPEIKETFEKESPGVCPLCGSRIFESEKSFYCSSFKTTGCKFSIWKKSSGTTFTFEDAKLLLSGKGTKTKSCKSKEGKSYKAAFFLNGKNELERKFAQTKQKHFGGKK